MSDLDRLRAEVVSGLAAAVGVTGTPSVFGLHGRGGIGKTVLAAELTRDPQTLPYFLDGVFWVSLGQRADVVGAQRELVRWAGGDPDAIRSPLQGTKVLGSSTLETSGIRDISSHPQEEPILPR